jgi:putative (di)nucleoside polyphosphate hydrolase
VDLGIGQGEAADPPSPPDLARYRPNVGIVLVNREGKVWLGRRGDAPGPRNWQFPQGGVDPGETLLSAALRELREETGAVSASLMARTSQWQAYAFPSSYRRSAEMEDWLGQKQIWFALRFMGDDDEFDLMADRHPEFDAWRWSALDEVMGHVVEFKQRTYARVIAAFRPLIEAVAKGA